MTPTKYTITQINRYTTNKQGDALMTRPKVDEGGRVIKASRPYTSVRIKTQEHGDKVISGFGSPENATWQVGDQVEIIIVPKGEYLNFSMPKRDSNTSGDKFGNSAVEIKNMFDLKLIPLMERNNAGIQNLEHMIKSLAAQVAMLVKQDVDEDPMSDFDRAIEDPTA